VQQEVRLVRWRALRQGLEVLAQYLQLCEALLPLLVAQAARECSGQTTKEEVAVVLGRSMAQVVQEVRVTHPRAVAEVV
jgi:hypothetical protein